MDASSIDILVLGHKGMLGWVVKKYMLTSGCKVSYLDCRWPTEEFKTEIKKSNANFLVNCIAAIPQKENKNFSINVDLPEFICENFNGKIIHPASNIEEFSEFKDDYSCSKIEASSLIKKKRPESLIIKSSTIGPSLMGNYGIWDYVEKSKGDIIGYENVFWNGITTLTWAKFSLSKILANEFGEFSIFTECISKYELIEILLKRLKKNNRVFPVKKQEKENLCLTFGLKLNNISEQIQNFIEWREKF